MNSFDELGIAPFLIEKLKERSIVKPTAIQSLVIPKLLAGENIVFRSATGTGKTFAYLLPALQLLASCEKTFHPGPQVLICTPTLELCSQIKTEIDFLTALPAESLQAKFKTVLLIGSVSLEKQIDSLKRLKPAIVVGNTGRLLVLAKMKKLNLNNLHFLILDEADRLTVPECLEETRELLLLIERNSNKQHSPSPPFPALQLTACSATVGEKTFVLLQPLFKSAQIAESDDHEILRERIEHWALFSERRRKVHALRSLLSALKKKKSRIKVLVFSSRGDDAEKVLSQLQYHSISAAGLFGKTGSKPLTSTERKEALDSFRQNKVDVLVSTDLAGRGLDIPGITHVIALDVPDSEFYIHRCGRTGRAGRRGIMITIGDEVQMRRLASLEKKLGIKIQPKELHHGQICIPEQEE